MNQGTLNLVDANRYLSLLVRFLHNTREGQVPVPVCKKRAVPALVPALAGLVTVAVESLNSFLQKK